MQGSLFKRVTRYVVGAAHDPRENRLTEVTAGVLERVDGLARVFTHQILRAGRDERPGYLADLAKTEWRSIEVRTQVATAQGRFVDLELLLRPPLGSSDPALLLWVEVKHGADLHGDQLDAYVADIGLRPVDNARRAVAVLAPRGWTPEDRTVPPQVLIAHWQDVARAIRHADLPSGAAADQWLRDEYIDYLKEEGLSDPDGLTAVSALALMEWNDAASAAAAIAETADDHVTRHWGERGSHQKTRGKSPVPDYWPGYYANYDAHVRGASRPVSWGGHVWFEWAMRDAGYLQNLETGRVRGALVFMAGVVLETSSNPTKVVRNREWFARRVADGFHYFWFPNQYRLARLRYPDELLAATGVENQGRALGEWIVDAFAALAADPPPKV